MRLSGWAVPLAIFLAGFSICTVRAQNPEPDKNVSTQNGSAGVHADEADAAQTSDALERKPASADEGTMAPAVVPSKKATLIFKRESSVLGAVTVNDAKVFIAEKQVCALANGKECTVEVEAGKLIVKIDAALSTGEFSKAFDFRPGKAYSFSVSVRTGASLASGFGGLLGMFIDNKVNQDGTGKDNGIFTAKLLEEK